jgi:polysaccharide pyruvyl transferase WcaK-like protein
MKIGILTFYWGENPGTALQAYSVLTIMRNMFPDADVQIVNYMYEKNRFIFHRGYIKHPLSFPKSLKRFNLYKQFVREELGVENAFGSNDFEDAKAFIKDKYDILICGSDTVWQFNNPGCKNFLFPNIYWIPASISAKKIAFSISSGASTIDKYPQEFHSMMREIINDFELIGFRDKITKELVEKIGLKDRSILMESPDPTFLFDIKKTSVKDKLHDIGLDLHKPVIGILGIPDSLASSIYSFYRAKGLQVVSIGYSRYADVSLSCLSPFEWAEVFRFLSLCVTDRFHATVFSLKNKTPVVAIDIMKSRYTDSGESKTQSLLRDFEIGNTNHFNIDTINSDKTAFLQKLESVRNDFDRDKAEESIKLQQKKLELFLDKVKVSVNGGDTGKGTE